MLIPSGHVRVVPSTAVYTHVYTVLCTYIRRKSFPKVSVTRAVEDIRFGWVGTLTGQTMGQTPSQFFKNILFFLKIKHFFIHNTKVCI